MWAKGMTHIVGVLSIQLASALIVCAQAPSDPAFADARINDVKFVDPQQGWAVGDRGVIWHTVDGGRHWELQTSQVDSTLTAVGFTDAQHGWAAGGYTRPYTQTTAGVLLETRDGGQNWRHDTRLTLPALRTIKFFDGKHGWAIGQATPLFATSVFATDDGGRSWSSLPASEEANWLAGDFIDPLTGVLAGRTSALATIRRRGIETSRTADFGLRTLGPVRLTSATNGWLVGDGGLVLHTADGGRTWQSPPGELPAAAIRHFDFHALATQGTNHCWVAGSPGTQIIRTLDGGQTWQTANTGQNLPIRALNFADEQHGWAVGDLGLILSTTDGGSTWQRQHSGGARAALAGFYAKASEVPLELFARLSADEGYLGVVQIINRQDLDARKSEQAEMPSAIHEATIRAGGSAAETAWQFPVRESGLNFDAQRIIEGWDRTNDNRGLAQLDSYLVRQIRIWRPSVIFISGISRGQTDPQSQLIAQAMLQAVEHAADPTRHSDQIAEAGLQPWQVEKIFSSLPRGNTGTVNVSTDNVSLRLGRSVGDLAAVARGVISNQHEPAPPALGFRLLVDQLPQEIGSKDFFSGIALSPGSDARRALLPISEEKLSRLQHIAQTRRNLQSILAQAEASDAQAGRWLGEVGQIAGTLDEASGSEVLFQLGQTYYRQGRWELAADTFEMLAKGYPQNPLAAAGLVWLVQYYSSSEVAWHNTKVDQIHAQQVTKLDSREPAKTRDSQPPKQLLQQVTGLVTTPDHLPQRAGLAMERGKQLEQLQAALFAEPRVRFALAVAHRRQGLPRQAEKFYLSVERTRQHDAWWAVAQSEQWLLAREGTPPKSMTTCRHAPEKPRLDGQLDDSLWQSIRPLELHSPTRDDASWPAVAMLAYDDEFLYLAASCQQSEKIIKSDVQRTRVRDSDLSKQDRIEFCLDLDRDRTTFYRLAIDQRGLIREDCWGNVSWNPRWFVAAARDGETWTVEAAIPLVELSPDSMDKNQIWAMGITRIAPGVGLQSWSAPAGVEPLGEGFGLLFFE